jgi:hypothetical protein
MGVTPGVTVNRRRCFTPEYGIGDTSRFKAAIHRGRTSNARLRPPRSGRVVACAETDQIWRSGRSARREDRRQGCRRSPPRRTGARPRPKAEQYAAMSATSRGCLCANLHGARPPTRCKDVSRVRDCGSARRYRVAGLRRKHRLVFTTKLRIAARLVTMEGATFQGR